MNSSGDECIAKLAEHVGVGGVSGERLSAELLGREIGKRILRGVGKRRYLLVLDGLEVLQAVDGQWAGQVKDQGIRALLDFVTNAAAPRRKGGAVIVTSRVSGEHVRGTRAAVVELGPLPADAAVELLKTRSGSSEIDTCVSDFIEEVKCHALTLTLAAGLGGVGSEIWSVVGLREFIASKEAQIDHVGLTKRSREKAQRLPAYVLRHCHSQLSEEERRLMRIVSHAVRPVSTRLAMAVWKDCKWRGIPDDGVDLRMLSIAARLRGMRLLVGNDSVGYDAHPLVKLYFMGGQDARTQEEERKLDCAFYRVLYREVEAFQPNGLMALQPLMDAVVYACRGKLFRQAMKMVYERIERRVPGAAYEHAELEMKDYLISDLGASEAKVRLMACFFPKGNFSRGTLVRGKRERCWIENSAAFALSTVGRSREAVPLYEKSLQESLYLRDSANAIVDYRNLCFCYARLGAFKSALQAARDGVALATQFSRGANAMEGSLARAHGYLGAIQALMGEGEEAMATFERSRTIGSATVLHSVGGRWYTRLLARRGMAHEARDAASEVLKWARGEGGIQALGFALSTCAYVERLIWLRSGGQVGDLETMNAWAIDAVKVGKRAGNHFYSVYIDLEAIACLIVSKIAKGKKTLESRDNEALAEVERRAIYGGYRMILADSKVIRALAVYKSSPVVARRLLDQAKSICDEPDCGYGFGKEDAGWLERVS